MSIWKPSLLTFLFQVFSFVWAKPRTKARNFDYEFYLLCWVIIKVTTFQHCHVSYVLKHSHSIGCCFCLFLGGAKSKPIGFWSEKRSCTPVFLWPKWGIFPIPMCSEMFVWFPDWLLLFWVCKCRKSVQGFQYCSSWECISFIRNCFWR